MAIVVDGAIGSDAPGFEQMLYKRLAMRGIYPDECQSMALAALSELASPARKSRLRKLFHSPRTKTGVYLWGKPGRGKTVLMDAFYRQADIPKRRVHFHEFLRDMHQRLARLSGSQGRFHMATREFCADIKLLCFDEFHVHDIADSVFIGKVFEALLEQGIRIVATSNYEPTRLMPDPVTHERFKPTIALIYKHFDVVHLDGGKDYRTQHEIDHNCFLYPLDNRTDKALCRLFKSFEPQAMIEVCHIEIANRWVECHACGEKTVWTNFDMLCKAQRSYVDYLDLAKQFEILILSGITSKSLENPNTVKRFLWLIDILYDKKKHLIMSSQSSYEIMLRNASGVDDLDRTLSRLHEMNNGFGPPL